VWNHYITKSVLLRCVCAQMPAGLPLFESPSPPGGSGSAGTAVRGALRIAHVRCRGTAPDYSRRGCGGFLRAAAPRAGALRHLLRRSPHLTYLRALAHRGVAYLCLRAASLRHCTKHLRRVSSSSCCVRAAPSSSSPGAAVPAAADYCALPFPYTGLNALDVLVSSMVEQWRAWRLAVPQAFGAIRRG